MGFIEFLKSNWFQISTFLITTSISVLSIILTLLFNKKNKLFQKELEKKADIYKRFLAVEKVLNNEFYPQISVFIDEEKIIKNHVEKLTKIIKDIRKKMSYLRFDNLEIFEKFKDILVEIQSNAISIFTNSDVKENKKKMNENTKKLNETINIYLKIK